MKSSDRSDDPVLRMLCLSGSEINATKLSIKDSVDKIFLPSQHKRFTRDTVAAVRLLNLFPKGSIPRQLEAARFSYASETITRDSQFDKR